MSILLIRHGETALNAARVMQPADTPLSAVGLRQADALATRLADFGLAALVASDLPRAWHTALAVATTTGLTPMAEPRLHERNFGALRGRPYDTLGFDPLSMREAPPGGESAAAFEQRAGEVFDALVALRAGLPGPLAVVTHGLLIRTMLATRTRLPEGVALPHALANTSITVVSAMPPHTVSVLDCTRHLDDGLEGAHAGLSGG